MFEFWENCPFKSSMILLQFAVIFVAPKNGGNGACAIVKQYETTEDNSCFTCTFSRHHFFQDILDRPHLGGPNRESLGSSSLMIKRLYCTFNPTSTQASPTLGGCRRSGKIVPLFTPHLQVSGIFSRTDWIFLKFSGFYNFNRKFWGSTFF